MWTIVTAPAAAQEAPARTVDRVVAVVETEPVLESQVRLEEDLTAVDPSPLPGWTAVFPDPLDRVIVATMLRALAADVPLYQPTRDQIVARREAVRAVFADPREWDRLLARHGLDESGLDTVLRRRMVVEKLLLRNLVSPPDDLARWTAECSALVEQRRPRVRVRIVPPLVETE